MKDSTRAIFKMHGMRIDHALHNYLYFAQYDRYVALFLKAGRWLARNLKGSALSRIGFNYIFSRYHAKVITETDATKILTLNRSLNLGPDTTERIIPFKLANQIIFAEPDFIAVMDCPCRRSRPHPCEPVNVCIAVGKTTAHFWLDHGERFNVRKISQAEALELIKSERKKGHITTAWFKVETGARTGVICSCCKCCCGGLEGMKIARSVKGMEKASNIIPSGYLVSFEAKKCEQCGACGEVCVFEAIKFDDHGRPTRNHDACMGCGLCVEHCPQGALSLELPTDAAGLLPLDLELAEEMLIRK